MGAWGFYPLAHVPHKLRVNSPCGREGPEAEIRETQGLTGTVGIASVWGLP